MHCTKHVAAAITFIVALSCATAADAPTKESVAAAINRGQAWLLAQQQDNGAFLPGNQFAVAMTAMVVGALAEEPCAIPASDPRIQKAIGYLRSFKQPNGGIYDAQEGLADYGTSLTLIALKATKTDDPELVKGAQEYLFGIQNQDANDSARGGLGYGDEKPGDENLNSTEFAMRALRSSGVSADDPHMKAALEFVQRCQNLSTVNDQKWAGGDGGAVYSPKESKAEGSWASEEDKAAGKTQAESGTLNSYGSMTYALISSYVALDLKPEDPRVAAALAWVKDHYQFDANPGMRTGAERQGLLYYYLLMARTMDKLDYGKFTLKDGKEVDWRTDLFQAIMASAIRNEVGGDKTGGLIWMNSEKRWGESVPHIATTYMVSALKHISNSL
jgi:squalene-hopene/tetraprenyl-beta-curcumene cyclase